MTKQTLETGGFGTLLFSQTSLKTVKAWIGGGGRAQRSIWGAPTAGLREMSKGGCFGHFLARDDIFFFFFFTFQFRSGLWGPSQHGMGWAGPLHVGTGWESRLQPTQR